MQEPLPSEALPTRIARVISRSAMLSALAACVTTGAAAIGLTYLSTQIVGNYGWAVFIVEPVVLGLVAALLHGWYQPRSVGQSLAVAAIGGGLIPAIGLLFLGIEGLGCLLMAAALWMPLVLVGGVFGWMIQRRFWPPIEQRGFPVIFRALAFLMLVPITFGFERIAAPAALTYEVWTTTDIDAPPEVVWKQIVTLPPLPPPREWIFRAGIACPMGTRTVGSGVGAQRFCDLSTGAMAERITTWDPARRLAFEVLQTPSPMREWSFYHELHPRHLDGYFTVLRGQFDLQALPDGRTRLTGTSWYQTRISPVAYWSCWCDYIVHAVHRRVFAQIAGSATAAKAAPAAP